VNNERTKADLADLLDTVNTHIRSIADAQTQRAALVATASARQGRVQVTVNADGVPIETVFGDDIEDLDYDDIAMAVTEAAQDAAAEVARKAEELIAPIRRTRSRLPNLSEIVADLPDLHSRMPEPQRASFDPPAARGQDQDSSGSQRWTVADDAD
jgi:DNA-binding protein YbaB